MDASVKLAQAGEKFGYMRFWIAEHHDLPGIASSVPEVMLGYIGAQTTQIRIGSGALLLPHYKPYKVAEIFNMLATLFPGRIDIGLGRAPGGSAEVTNALNDNFLQKVYAYPELVEELVRFVNNEDDKLRAAPIPETPPMPWILGTSKKSALLAAKNGLAYAFGQFMSDADGPAIIQAYRDAFQSGPTGQQPQVLLTVSAICAETAAKAEEIATSSLIWKLQTANGGGEYVPSIEEAKSYVLEEKDKEKLEKMKRGMIIGEPNHVVRKLEQLQEQYHADEIMILTITHSHADKIHSYKLIAEEMNRR
ncbi:LLM class flavin-dependent oxidoreductase [Virgibacillus sp. 179-BFC.A HS]|uniref:LLM class flavin-dependent oxidoreductase n=1 Tax=Tigheibacillus jepli TaxID=3035914 RepID=A0ABU5CJF5_9BACI|nr:LLM class flavin-dependent oxidoreductase [Virgibacillus sp. 179-BFC.A HS]MDY0406440.1 LLM class flavin-dependent oxidoreductase [Virgibacillus sp. 179-BFC.A HS]